MTKTFPIVKVKTIDRLTLYGLLLEPEDNKFKTIKIHIHGDAGDFFYNDFYPYLAKDCLEKNIAFLSTNNRGAWVYENSSEYVVPHGTAAELFGDCIRDLDAWIRFALDKGYEKIILEGHSRGTEKIVYYMNHGKYVNKVVAIILLGFSDAYGTQINYEKKIGHDFFVEAKELIQLGKGKHLLSDLRAFAGELPMTADTYVNTMKQDSANSKALPFRDGKNLSYFKNIHVPILGVIGDKFEYTVIPIEQAIKLLRSENKLAEIYQIKNSDHGFTGKEKELVILMSDFIRKIIPSL